VIRRRRLLSLLPLAVLLHRPTLSPPNSRSLLKRPGGSSGRPRCSNRAGTSSTAAAPQQEAKTREATQKRDVSTRARRSFRYLPANEVKSTS
jgi:hypothetical protein